MSTTIQIMGGLGNHLFEIFTLISYSLKEKRYFYFENIPLVYGRTRYYWDTPLLNKLSSFVKNIPHSNGMVTYRESAFNYNTIPIDNTSQMIKLIGYFQSEKYFLEHKDLIFRMINLKESKELVREKVAPILPTAFENIVSLHFRVGDYAHQQQNHPVMPVDYYEKALEQLLIDTSDKKDWFILYFCEENDIDNVTTKINTLKQNEKFKEFTFIKIPGNLDDWEQMLTMSLCKHHIIANSTFSWWGAYFGDGGLVYYPGKWFGPGMGVMNTNDLCPDAWKKISF